MRRSLIVGNWKLNGTKGLAVSLAKAVMDGVEASKDVDIAICAPYVYLPELSSMLKGHILELGAQNVADHDSGAYTGEISAEMLAEFSCKYAIVGHSERREYYGDSNESVAARFCQAIEAGIIPILCVGETLEQREQEQTFQVIDAQLEAVIAKAGIEAFKQASIAYEPVWAIGTGKTASPEQAEEVHKHIRQLIAEKNVEIANNLPIIYGGSVKPNNAESLFSMPDIDGALIGGASLIAEDFLSIYQSA
jgi:triosephosphate isomerase (TIM)